MAAPVLLYLLKANVALLLFAAAYFGLLRRLTFFTLNRFYLLFALMFAAVYPTLPVPALLPVEAATPVALVVMEASGGGPGALAGPVVPPVDWAAVGLGLYAIGAAILLVRLLVQLLSLRRRQQQSQPAVINGLPVRVLTDAVSPFSFWQTIYLNPAQHPAPELAAVLCHELVHVRQWHTLDVLLAQLALAAAWCNPAAWLLRRALLDNLEFLADHAVLQDGLDRRAYQYSLLRLSHEAAAPSLVSSFTFPTLKNRVIMMNTPASALTQTGRYLLALPLALSLAVGVGAVLSPAAAAPAALTTALAPVVYYLDGKLSDKATVDALDPKTIAYINFVKEKEARQVFGPASGQIAIVVTIANQHSTAVLALNKRVDRVAPLVPATPAQQVAIAAAQAYLLKTYPNAKVIFIGPDHKASTTAPRYRADFEDGGQTKQQYFNAQGQPVDPATTGKPMGVIPTAAPVQATQPVPYLATPTLTYITKNHPDARLLAMTEVPATAGNPSTYKAQLAIGRRPISLLFDERGRFISEVSSAR